MNTWEIDWELNVPEEDAILHLNNLLFNKPYKFQIQKSMKPKLKNGEFRIVINRSLLWGTALRKEIEGKGSIGKTENGSYLSAMFQVSSPYCYVHLNSTNLKYLIPAFILSWIGLIVSLFILDHSTSLDLVLFSVFFVSCFILIIGFIRYVSIDDKFKETIKMFETSFSNLKMDVS